MCNLYACTMSQEAMRNLFDLPAGQDRLGNFKPLPAIWPKYEGPVLRLDGDGRRELTMMRWGFLTPQISKKTGKPISPAAWNNARDDKLARTGLWQDSFKHRRCLIPANAFREAKGRNPATDYWFAVKGRNGAVAPPFAFAGLWREGQPGVEGEAGDWTTYTMVTTTANKLVQPVHPTRMPVILDPPNYNLWLKGETDEVLALLRPFAAGAMEIVSQGVGKTSFAGADA